MPTIRRSPSSIAFGALAAAVAAFLGNVLLPMLVNALPFPTVLEPYRSWSWALLVLAATIGAVAIVYTQHHAESGRATSLRLQRERPAVVACVCEVELLDQVVERRSDRADWAMIADLAGIGKTALQLTHVRQRRFLDGQFSADLRSFDPPGSPVSAQLPLVGFLHVLDDPDSARRRLVDLYLHPALGAAQLLDPHRESIDIGHPVDDYEPFVPTDSSEALLWFGVQHQYLMGVQRLAYEQGWYELVWQLAWVMTIYQRQRGRLSDYVTAQRAGLLAAKQLNDMSHGRVLITMGWCHSDLGRRHRHARANCEEALAVNRHYGYREGVARAAEALGHACHRAGEHPEAIQHLSYSATLFRDLGITYKEADALAHLGDAVAAVGQRAEARETQLRALDMYKSQQRAAQAQRVRRQASSGSSTQTRRLFDLPRFTSNF